MRQVGVHVLEHISTVPALCFPIRAAYSSLLKWKCVKCAAHERLAGERGYDGAMRGDSVRNTQATLRLFHDLAHTTLETDDVLVSCGAGVWSNALRHGMRSPWPVCLESRLQTRLLLTISTEFERRHPSRTDTEESARQMKSTSNFCGMPE